MQVGVKWQPWSARYDLPLFTVLAVPLGVGLARLPARTGAAIVALLVAGALPALVLNVHRPLIDIQAVAAWPVWTWGVIAGAAVVCAWLAAPAPRRVRAIAAVLVVTAAAPIATRLAAAVFARQPVFPPLSIVGADRTHVMFRGNPSLEAVYGRAAERVRDSRCDVVGLEFRRDAWEYPLWALLGAASGGGPRLRAVAVANESVTLADEGPEPCVVVSAATVSAFDGRAGWSREVLSDEPYLALHRRVDAAL
jgi:hypothetical protein